MRLTQDEKKLNELFDELVPTCGKAETAAGEIVRAVTRIGFRWWNDGDMIGVGYGKETLNAPARFLAENCGTSVSEVIYSMWGIPEYDYEFCIPKLNRAVLEYLEEHPELKTTVNTDDMFNYFNKHEDVDDTDYEDDWWG